MYAPDSPMTRAIMLGVAASAGLVFGVDVMPVPGATAAPWDGSGGDTDQLTWVNTTLFNAGDGEATCAASVGACADGPRALSGDCLPCAFAADNRTLALWHSQHRNSTQNSLHFFGAYANESSYSVWYNATLLAFPLLADTHTQSVKVALDTAMLTAFANASGERSQCGSSDPASDACSAPLLDYRVSLRAFPRPAPRVPLYDAFAANGGQWLFTVPSVAFFFLLTELVHEK